MTEMKEVRIDRRKTLFIEKSFQVKFIIKFCLLVIAGGLLTAGILYFLSMRSTTVAIVNSEVVVKTTADFLLPILIQTVVVVMILLSIATIIVTLIVSHKIAGPLYRLKKAMHDLGEGDFSTEINLRKFDQLKHIAQEFNNMAGKLKKKLSR
jgi:signal transduction histidine kinase